VRRAHQRSRCCSVQRCSRALRRDMRSVVERRRRASVSAQSACSSVLVAYSLRSRRRRRRRRRAEISRAHVRRATKLTSALLIDRSLQTRSAGRLQCPAVAAPGRARAGQGSGPWRGRAMDVTGIHMRFDTTATAVGDVGGPWAACRTQIRHAL